MTQPTDDLAAQMVREIHDTGCIAIHFSDFAALEAIARRYMEKGITAQAEEIERLRDALEAIAEVDDDGFTSDGHESCVEWAQRALKAAQEVKA